MLERTKLLNSLRGSKPWRLACAIMLRLTKSSIARRATSIERLARFADWLAREMSHTVSLSLKKALEALAQPGARMMLMHDSYGKDGTSYYVVPGGRVAPDDAEKIIARGDVIQMDDGLFPGHPQTYQRLR